MVGTVKLGDILFPDDETILKRYHRRALNRGNYEKPERQALEGLLGPHDRVLELGSGIGFMSTLIARDYGVEAIQTFEANPLLIPFIRDVHALNNVSSKVDLVHGLLSEKPGPDLDFYVRENFSGSSLLKNPTGRVGPVLSIEKVPQHPFGTVRAAFKASILICDIEGAEADLLPKLDLSHFDAAVVELHPKVIGLSGVKAIVDAFSSAGLAPDPDRTDHLVFTFRRVQ